jgi:ribosomal protein L37AE/L43A
MPEIHECSCCGKEFAEYREEIGDYACDDCYHQWQTDHLEMTIGDDN